MSRTAIPRAPVIWVALLALFGLLGGNTHAQTWAPRPVEASLLGSGPVSQRGLYQAWASTYGQSARDVAVDYLAVSPTQAQRNFVRYQTDFGVTDLPFDAAQLAAEAPDALYLPIAVNAVVPVYNLPGVSGLRFSAETLTGIFLRAISRWDDPRIRADNPGVRLPDLAILPVARAESSAATAILTDYLSKVSVDWRAEIGAGPVIRWPGGVARANGARGVSDFVGSRPGAIGYVELSYALANGITPAEVRNASGAYVAASPASASAGARRAFLAADLTGSIANSSHPEAYPVVGLSYALVREVTYTDLAKAQALADFLYWGLSEGSGATARLGFGPLPPELTTRAAQQLERIRVGGQQVFDAPGS
jgi:phosphate transport system substrate-binding protein